MAATGSLLILFCQSNHVVANFFEGVQEPPLVDPSLNPPLTIIENFSDTCRLCDLKFTIFGGN